MIKSKMEQINSMDIMCATEVEEFFYKDTDEPVEEGEPVGLDIDYPFEVEFVLISTIFSVCSYTGTPIVYDTDLYYVNHAPHPQGCECCLIK